jgi:lactoylglutathione lyase
MMHVYSSVVIVSDQDAALDFYVGKLGWEVRQDNQMSPDYRFLAVAPPGHSTAIVLGPPARPRPARADAGGPGLQRHLPDERRRAGRLRTPQRPRGRAFDQVPEPMPWGGFGARFHDVDGNVFFVSDAG